METRTVVEAVVETAGVGAKEERVLVLNNDECSAALSVQVLAQAELDTLRCGDAAMLHEALNEGAGAALVADNALCPRALEHLSAALGAQPHWSDLPLLLYSANEPANEEVGRPGYLQSVAEQLSDRLGSSYVFVLEPSLRRATLLSTVRLALNARRQQYEVRDLLKQLDDLSTLERQLQARTAALRRSEVRFAKAFYASPIPSAITTLTEGRYVDINDRALELLGYERDEVIGGSASLLSGWEAESSLTRVELLSRLHEEGSLKDVEICYRTRSGEVCNTLATFEVIEREGELCLLSMVVDVSERKRSEADLMQAAQEVMKDAAWFSRSFVEKLAQVRTGGANAEHQTEVKDLTPREREVLERVAAGYGNAQIAAALHLSENTVRNYLANVFSKLNVHTRAEAVVWARTRGLGSGV